MPENPEYSRAHVCACVDTPWPGSPPPPHKGRPSRLPLRSLPYLSWSDFPGKPPCSPAPAGKGPVPPGPGLPGVSSAPPNPHCFCGTELAPQMLAAAPATPVSCPPHGTPPVQLSRAGLLTGRTGLPGPAVLPHHSLDRPAVPLLMPRPVPYGWRGVWILPLLRGASELSSWNPPRAWLTHRALPGPRATCLSQAPSSSRLPWGLGCVPEALPSRD